MDNPRLWNGTADPFMYDVIVRLMDDSLLCDEVTVPLGLRYFSVDPKQGFLLNGRHTGCGAYRTTRTGRRWATH